MKTMVLITICDKKETSAVTWEWDPRSFQLSSSVVTQLITLYKEPPDGLFVMR